MRGPRTGRAAPAFPPGRSRAPLSAMLERLAAGRRPRSDFHGRTVWSARARGWVRTSRRHVEITPRGLDALASMSASADELAERFEPLPELELPGALDDAAPARAGGGGEE